MANDFGTTMPFKSWEESISSLQPLHSAVTPRAGAGVATAGGRLGAQVRVNGGHLRNRVRAILGIGTVFVAFLAASTSPLGAEPPDATFAKPSPLKLKVKPDCKQDVMLNEALQWSKTDLKVVLRVGISASGTVDKVRIAKVVPADNKLARRWAESLVRCWYSAVYDTAGVNKTAFPAYVEVNVAFKAVRDTNGHRKN